MAQPNLRGGGEPRDVAGATETPDSPSKIAETGSTVGPYEVSAQSNIFGAGHSIAPGPAGYGAGTLPVGIGIDFTDVVTATFPYVTGTTTYYSPCGGPIAPPDGYVHGIVDIQSYGGISGIVDDHGGMLLGVFIGGDEPTDPAPSRLDFTGNHDFVELSPALGQTFFIGNGRTDANILQQFRVPDGTARLLLGIADAVEFRGPPGAYDDNCGAYHATAAPGIPPLDTPATCVVTALRAGPPAEQEVTAQDADGVAEIVNFRIENGSLTFGLSPGQTRPMIFTATKQDQSRRTFWEFELIDNNGQSTHCV